MNHYFVESFPVGYLQCNCSIIFDPNKKQALIVDPGDEFEKIVQRLNHHDVSVWGMWHTHAHLDHIGATKKLFDLFKKRNKDKYNKPEPKVFLDADDEWLYTNVDTQAQMLGHKSFEVTKNFTAIKEGFLSQDDNFKEAYNLKTPGHTPGSCCLHLKSKSTLDIQKNYIRAEYDKEPEILFTGDTLFHRSVGRTDLWGGDSQKITKSIHKLYNLPENTVVIPGHGPITSIEEEAKLNPFVKKKK